MSHSSTRHSVILLIRNAAAHDFGGAETYPVSLAMILQEEGYKPIIVTRSEKLLNYATKKSVLTQRGWWWSRQNWSGGRTLLFPLYIAWQIILTCWYIILIAKTRAAVLHIQSKDDFIAGTIAGRFMHRKIVWTDHMDLRYVFQNIAKPFRNPVGKIVFWAAHLAHHIILISENEHRLVTSHFKKKNALRRQIILVKNGVMDKGVAIQKKHANPVVFCLASRMVISKGVGEAIKAFKGLQQSLADNKRVLLAIYGDGADMEKFQQLAGDNENITFYGHQENAIEKVREANVFLLPSYQEGLSIALLEATMLGKAIIASDIDSNPEIIMDHETGLLVAVRDVQSLQDAMHTLVVDENLRHSLEVSARKNFEKNFNLVTIVKEQIVPLYST